MTTIFSGYMALGTSSAPSFTELTGATGYSRQAVTLNSVTGAGQTNAADTTFTASGSDWSKVTQKALFTASSGGTALAFWNIKTPFTLANSSSHTTTAGTENIDLGSTFGTSVGPTYQAGMAEAGPIFSYVTLAAATGATGSTGATGPTGPTGPALSGPTTPASATATGTTGTVVWDATHLYVCVATNTWVRVTTATW